jgi:hypothetical protein
MKKTNAKDPDSEVENVRDLSPRNHYDDWKLAAIQISFLILLVLAYHLFLAPHNGSSCLFGTTSCFGTSVESESCNPPRNLDLLHKYGKIPSEATSFGALITASETSSRLLFEQGIVQLYNFNSDEAQRNFKACLSIDSSNLMCTWALSYSHCTNLNRFVTEEKEVSYGIKLNKAMRDLMDTKKILYTDFELVLAQLLLSRWPSSIDEWREYGHEHFDRAYLVAVETYMREQGYLTPLLAGNIDNIKDQEEQVVILQSIYIDIVMTCDRWSYYNIPSQNEANMRDSALSTMDEHYILLEKTLKEDKQDVYTLMLGLLSLRPQHTFINHLYIHMTEQSSQPQTGVEAAIHLRDTVHPASFPVTNGHSSRKKEVYSNSSTLHTADIIGAGHLAHMPAHTFIRTGMYAEAIDSSIRSIHIDDLFTKQCLTPYCPGHNIAVLIMAALYSGNSAMAYQYATLTLAQSDTMMATYIMGLFPLPLELIHITFGQWSALQSLLDKEKEEEASESGSSQQVLIDRELEDSKEKDAKEEWKGNNNAMGLSSRVRKGHQHRYLRRILSTATPPFLVAMKAYTEALLAINLPTKAEHPEAHKEQARLAVLACSGASNEVSSDEETSSITEDFVFYPYHREQAFLMAHVAKAAYYSHYDHLYHNNAAANAVRQAQGENYASFGKWISVYLLDAATKTQDGFNYMEPEHFYLPLRKCLGASLLDVYDAEYASSSTSKVIIPPILDEPSAEALGLHFDHFPFTRGTWYGHSLNKKDILLGAERVYRRDLVDHPNNIWSTKGLILVYERMLYAMEHSEWFDEKDMSSQNEVELQEEANDGSMRERRLYDRKDVLSLLSETQKKYKVLSGQMPGVQKIKGSCCELGMC